MEIIKDRNKVVYYYKDFPDLLTKEKEFIELKLDIGHFFGSVNPIKVCPRGNEIHILLWNSGDRDRDEEKLVEALGKLGMDFLGEL